MSRPIKMTPDGSLPIRVITTIEPSYEIDIRHVRTLIVLQGKRAWGREKSRLGRGGGKNDKETQC
jgi:hypothetical protein